MNPKEQLRHIIREELTEILAEAKTRAPRKGIGKNKKGKYTSAGTVPYIQGRKLSAQQVQNRKAIGQKMLNALRRGGPSSAAFKARLVSQLKDRGLAADSSKDASKDKLVYSMIWANASDIAAKGGTSADWNVGKPKKKTTGNKKKSGGDKGEQDTRLRGQSSDVAKWSPRMRALYKKRGLQSED
jgi:hypothetical protein